MNRKMNRLSLCICSGMLSCTLGINAFADENTQGFAKCDDYLSVRSGPSCDDPVIGKLYAGGEATILEECEDGWLHIQSGNVDGYVAEEYIATGEEADEIASNSGYTTALVGAYALNVRSEKTEDASVVGTVYENNTYEVVEDQGDWIKLVTADGTYGWVSSDYVDVETEYPHAETLEEEQERLDAQWLAYLDEQETASETVSYDEETASSDETNYSSDETAYAQTTADETAASDGTSASTDTTVSTEAAASTSDTAASTDTTTSTDTAASTDTTTETEAVYYDETPVTSDESASESDTTDSSGLIQDTSVSSGSATGQSVADYACQFVGNPYVWGGTSLTSGADCSGFVLSVYAQFGISLPHEAASQSGYGTAVSVSDLAPGDLVFYDYGSGISHVAIYIGNGSIVHAANESSGICYGSLGSPVACRRLV